MSIFHLEINNSLNSNL